MKLMESKIHRIRVLKNALLVIESLDKELYDRLLDNTNARPETTKRFIEALIEGIEQEQD